MKFLAQVSSRSSRSTSGPPGETEILRLNPGRRERILSATGWSELFEGTLNLEVAEDVVDQLGRQAPLIREPGELIAYPDGYKHIPKKRKAYLYFRGIIRSAAGSADVLFRRAEVPLKRRLEAFSPVRLRDTLRLSDGDEVQCELVSDQCPN